MEITRSVMARKPALAARGCCSTPKRSGSRRMSVIAIVTAEIGRVHRNDRWRHVRREGDAGQRAVARRADPDDRDRYAGDELQLWKSPGVLWQGSQHSQRGVAARRQRDLALEGCQ